ncbi:MAG: epoxyqueuosine reductase QueH [Treponema sp.]|nr:epoxyqueuosine reductase QueH [Treponema sp.]
MNLLLHVCCAPCSVMCVETLKSEGIEMELYWYNPNIHPFTEYKSRRDCLAGYAKDLGLALVVEDQYGLRDFIAGIQCRNTGPHSDPFAFPGRCAFCYRLRLEKAARAAKERGIAAFSTSLLISPYQDHELIKKTAQAAAEHYGVEFLYRDFRPFFRDGQAKARAAGRYMQKYCGCVFSEEERYCGAASADYRDRAATAAPKSEACSTGVIV